MHFRLFTFFLVVKAFTSFSQNIFDYQHTLSYANYLYKSRQYTLAAEEYERALFLSPANDSIATQLIKSYNLSGQCKQAKLRVKQLALYNDSMPNLMVKEYVKTLFCNNLSADVRTLLLTHKTMDAAMRAEHNLYLEIVSKNWKVADSILTANTDSAVSVALSKYKDVVYKANHMKHRSPALAVGMSAIIPGTGKIYAGRWKDGLIALVFVATTANQAYVGFSKKGEESVYGWINAGLATGFYIGNLYGSYKAAKKYNASKVHELLHEAEKIFNNDSK